MMNAYKDALMRTYTGDMVTTGNPDETSAIKDGIYQPMRQLQDTIA